MWNDRVAPVLKSQIEAGNINLKAIVNTHQYVNRYIMSWSLANVRCKATGIMLAAMMILYV